MPDPDIKSDDYYKVLGVDRKASDTEIARAYKKLALKFHPDKNPDNKQQAEEKFKVITEAYEVLHDSDKRRNYDQFGKQGANMGGGGGPGGGVSFQHADEIFKAFFGGNDPFTMFFGGDGDDDMMFGGRSMGGGQRVVFQQGGFPGGAFDMADMGFGGMKGGGKGNRQQTRPAPLPQWVIPVGTEVTVRGLENSQEHNGRSGRISGFNQAKLRYELDMESEMKLSLRPGNVTQQVTVWLHGIESQPELNGQKAKILKYDDQKGRYFVKLASPLPCGKDIVGLQLANVMLPVKTRVVLQGLANEEFNGQMAQISEIDEQAQRYVVQCQNGKAIKIKFEMVLC